jgi:NADPH:quinone reductase-like Zn-dependent oxidoreductase
VTRGKQRSNRVPLRQSSSSSNHWGGYAEYALASSFTTFHLSPKTSFEAATIPIPYLTAVIGLYFHLHLPPPLNPTLPPTPFIIYGAASAVGAFAVKMARMSNIHSIIAVAGRGIPFVETLIDRSMRDVVIG